MAKKPKNKKLTAKDFFAKIKSLESNDDTIFGLQFTNQFKKSIDLSYARNFDLEPLFQVIEFLVQDRVLPGKNHAHKLKGDYAGVWECHIKPDWLLMWQEDRDQLILLLLSTATHSDFMNKQKR